MCHRRNEELKENGNGRVNGILTAYEMRIEDHTPKLLTL